MADQTKFPFFMLMFITGFSAFCVLINAFSTYRFQDQVKPFCDKMSYDEDTCKLLRSSIQAPVNRLEHIVTGYVNTAFMITGVCVLINKMAIHGLLAKDETPEDP
jgi:hypothetical protein